MLRSEKGLSKNTIEAYQTDLRHMPFDFFKVSSQDILSYFNNLDLNSRSVARKMSALKQFYYFMVRAKKCVENPVEKLASPKMQKPFPKTLTKEECFILIEKAEQKDRRLHTMLELLYATGMRISELITLKRTHFSYYESHPVLLVKGKGNKERVVPLNNRSHQALQEYLEILNGATGWLFPSFGKSGHITRQRLGQLLKELAVEGGIDPDKVSPHILRHAFATHMLRNGADLMLIKEILGHKNLSTSEIYLHVLPHDLMELVQEHHPAKRILRNDVPEDNAKCQE